MSAPLLVRSVLVVAVIGAGCKKKEKSGPGSGSGAALVKMSQAKTEACACKDATCARLIVRDLQQWGDLNAGPDYAKQLDSLTRELNDCLIKAASVTTSNPLSCPPDRPTNQTLNGDASANSAKVAVTDQAQPLKLRARAIPNTTYLTIFGQRPLAGNDGDHTYDVIDCIDSSMANQWRAVRLADSAGQPYRRIRMRMWNPSHAEIKMDARQDPGTGEMGPIQNITLKCSTPTTTTIDDLVTLERAAGSGAADAGVADASAGDAP
jgi:hypothetical protein